MPGSDNFTSGFSKRDGRSTSVAEIECRLWGDGSRSTERDAGVGIYSPPSGRYPGYC